MPHEIIDRRPARRTQVAPTESRDSTVRGMSYVPHSHGAADAQRVFCGLAKVRPLPVSIVEREMHCRVTAEKRKCTDAACFVLLVVCLAFWAGAAVFVIPRADWRRVVYGSDSLGRVCGEGDWEQRKRRYFPSVKSDLQVLRAADGDDAEVDVYNDLVSVCVEECPSAGEVVCIDDFLLNMTSLPNASEVLQCYGGVEDPDSDSGAPRNEYYMDNYDFCSSCWVSAMNTTDVFFHCVEDQSVATTSVLRCTFPENPADVSDPEHLEPDDPRCLVVSETVVVNTERTASDDDPVSESLAAAITGLPGWCLDIINTYAVILAVAPTVAGLVCFLCIISIGRGCKIGRCCDRHDAFLSETRFCSATSFFVWTFLVVGLIVAIGISGVAWLNTGLFSVDVAVEFLDNSSNVLEQSISSALGGFTVNVTDLGLDLFSGSLSELAGVQVRTVLSWFLNKCERDLIRSAFHIDCGYRSFSRGTPRHGASLHLFRSSSAF